MADIIVSGRCARELLYLQDELRDILRDIEQFHWPVGELVITSIHRTEEENTAAGARSKVHVVGPPYRAADLRIRNLGDYYQEEGERIAEIINRTWLYDPDRPNMKVAIAKLHGTGPHIHLQVHPRTVRR